MHGKGQKWSTTSPTILSTKDKNIGQQACKISNILVDKPYPCELSDNSYTRQITTNQQDNIDLTKKQMQTINRTTQNWLKVENKEVVHEEFPHMNL